MTAKHNGSSECIAVLKDKQGFTGHQFPCSTNLSVLYIYRSDSTHNYYKEMAGTWNDVRHCIEQSSFWFVFPNKYEDIYEGRYIWTGLSRNTSTSRPLTAPSDCFKLQRHKQTLEEETDNCHLELPFICQKVPVNCGESFMKTESSLNFTIESGSNDMNCEWNIEGFDNTFIRIEISFVIPSCKDCECLKIYDAPTTIGPPNKTLCEHGQLTFNSTQQAITLAYSSDGSIKGTRFHAKWSFVPWPRKSTTSMPLGSTINSRTGSEDMTTNTFSAGFIGGIVGAAVVITVSVIVCIVVIRRKCNGPQKTESNYQGLNMRPVGANSGNPLDQGEHLYRTCSNIEQLPEPLDAATSIPVAIECDRQLPVSISHTNDKVYYNTRGDEAQYDYCA
ncbi:hypothetical protein DPMN_130041 [Dreissena polymorpha]|uniref:CUB domain-containing protein n=1 Tax=Dreissena polymorpha TaxID=45954 RepID=A0A9D4H5W5_DREPO|nr:hypothetical protein DPMN_130041 [Dreissena polymorpha]